MHCILGIKIPLNSIGFIAVVVAVMPGLVFLWWWFRKRNAGQAKIKSIVSSTPTQPGELYENSGTLSFIHKNKLVHHTLSGIREISVKEASSPQVYNFQIELTMNNKPHLVLEAQNHGNQLFTNQVLEHLGKEAIDWKAPLPQLHKMGNLTVNGYKIDI